MNRCSVAIVALISLSLHIIVPPGFMPANVSDGWHLKWCPDGVSAEVMEVLFEHQHHDHHHHRTHAHDHQTEREATLTLCDLSGLHAEIEPSSQVSFATNLEPSSPGRPATHPSPRQISPASYQSRAPPLLIAI